MPNKVNYRTFSQRVKNKYPEYINMGDLELAQMWVEQNPQYGEFVVFDQQPVKKKDQVAPSLGAQGGLPSQQPSVQPRRAKEERFFGGAFGDALDMLDMPTPGVPGSGLGIGDFIDDMGRAFSSGKKAGVNMSASRPLFFSGPGSSDEEVQNFVKAGTEYTGPSDEATQFYKDYEDNGKTTFGFVKALAKNPGIAPELVVQSASQLLFNPEARAAAGSVILGGASAGAIATAPAGGIGAAPGAIASIPLAVAAANTTVSTLSSFSELMKKELDDRGLEFNEDNVRTILEDENALRKIRAKSAGYGITIGAFDLATAKVGGAIAAKIPMSTRAGKIKATLSTTGVEAVGGSAGEAAARGVTGQELDPAEIGLEGIAEIPGAAPTLLSQVLKRPAYKINGEFVGQSDVEDVLQNSTRQELENTKLEVFNDAAGYSKKIANRIDELKTRDAVIEANPNASNQEIDLLVGLNTKLKNLNEMDAESAKIAAETIRSEIKTIQKNLLQREISPETEQQAEQIAPEAPQMAPAEVSPEVGVEIPQPQESVLEGPKMPPLEDLEFDNIEFVEPVITPVETQLVGEKKSPLIKETFQGVTRPRKKPGEVRAPLMEQVTEGGVFKAKLRDSKTGTEFIVEDPELSLDLAIAAQVRESGRTEFPQPAFLEAFNEVVDADPELQTLFPNISETGQPLSLEQRAVSLDGKKVTRNVVQRMQPLYAALEQRMNNAEEIPMSEIEAVVDQIIQLQQEIQNQKGKKTVRAANGVRQEFTPLTDEQKRIFNDFTDALVNKLLSYDFATTTTTGPTTQKTTTAGLIATPREGRPLPEARVQRERLEGAEVTIEGRGRGRIAIKPLPGLGERSVYGITFEETGAEAPETISPTARETGTTPAAVGVEPQTEQDVRQETNAPQEGRGQGENAAPVPQEEGRQEGQVTPPAVAQEGETPPAAKRTRKTKQQKADEGKAMLDKLKETLRALKAKPGGGANIDLTFGVVPISKAVWNTAIDTAILAIDAGQSIAQAVKAASDYISSKIDGDWGKAKFEQYMEDLLTEARGMIRERVSYIPFPEGLALVDGWYSTIEKKVRESKQDKQSASAWLNSGLIGKGDEATYTGVRGWLEEKKPNEAVSKQEILDWMKDNRIEINEVAKSDEPKMSIDEAKRVFEDNGYYVGTDRNGDIYVEKEGDFRPYSYEEMSSIQQDAFDALTKNNLDRRISDPTRYSDYQLEGKKENYKEVVVTLPSEAGNLNEIAQSLYQKRYTELNPGERVAVKREARKSGQVVDESGIFKSTHFDETNILVHLRMNTRTDADGNKVLFIEEIQSDWGQRGKKYGFGITEQEISRLKELGYEYKDGEVGMMVNNIFVPRNYNDLVGEAAKIARKAQFNAPPAPFVTDTNAWTKLAVKIAMREAAKQGVDKIAWTTGEQQNERYDLSKQVDEITYSKYEGGIFSGTYQFSGSKDEIQIFNYQGIPEDKLEDYVGKEVAKKIIDGEGDVISFGSKEEGTYSELGRTLSGVDLRVVGKGMKGFYDKIVPDAFKSVVKELTGQDAVIRETILDIPANYALEQTTQQSIFLTPRLKGQIERGMPLFEGEKASVQQRAEKVRGEITRAAESMIPAQQQAQPEAKPEKTIAEQRKEFRETAKKYFDGLKKMGIAFDPERNSKEDIAFLKALSKYIKLELDAGMVTFKGFMEKTANLVEGFKEASVVKAAKDVWAKEVVKAYPKLYAKYSAAKRKELEREIKDIRKTMIRRIMDMTEPKIVNFKSQLKTEKRRLSKEAAAQLAAIRNAYDAKTMMAMEPEDLMELMRLTEGIYKEGRSEIKALNESLDEAAQIQGEEMLAAVTSKDKRLDKLSDKEAARKKLKFKSGVIVATNNDERVILKEEAELDALEGDNYEFLFLNTISDKVFTKGFLDSVVSFFSGKLRTINENARDLRTALELIKSKSKESQDFINGLVAKLNKASVTKARKAEEWSSILKAARTKFFGPDIKFGYTNWMNGIAKVNGKALELINGGGEPIGPINNGKIVSLYRQIMDPTNLVKTNGVRKINLSDESIQSIIDYMNLPANKPGKDFALTLTDFFLKVAEDTKVVLESNGYNSTKLDEKRYNKEDFEDDEFIGQVMGQFADTRTEGFIPYTPIQATESPDTIQGVEIKEDDLFDSADLQKNFSVISNNMITRRPGGVIVPTDIRQTLNAYTAGMANMNAKLPLLRETQAIFSKRNLKAMSNAFAPAFTSNLKSNYVSFMTDRVTPVISNKTEAALKTWLMTSTAIPMFLNLKSATLQFLATPNFAVSYDFSRYIDASKELLKDGKLRKETLLEIISLPTIKQRYGGRFSPDSRIISEEVGRYGKVAINIPFTNIKISAKELLSKGYIFSSIGDVLTIAVGGAPIYYDITQTNKRKYIAEGMSATEAEAKAKLDAEEKLFEIIQETQQSSEAMYLSEFQKQSITRLFSSFATATMQYYRKARRAASRMKNKEGNQLQNAYEILHYTAINAAFFQFFSSMLVDALSGPGEDELEEASRQERMDMLRYMEDVMATVAQGTGALGVALQALILGLKENQKSGKPEKILESTLRTTPALRMKFDAAVNAMREWKRGDYVRSISKGAELANIPADRIRALGLQVSDALTENLEVQERIARIMGYRTEAWMREKKQGEIWNGVEAAVDRSTPTERQRAISNTKSAYRDLFQSYGKRYAEATTDAERARVESIASKEILNIYNHRQGGPDFVEELNKLYKQSLEFNSLPKDLQKLKNMETNRKIGTVVEELLEKKSEQKSMEYWSSLVNNGILSKNEIDRVREEYNTRKGMK